jgi:DMSO/TMAO reductase YedYZ molybdopterin-dependent catalytic subunit
MLCGYLGFIVAHVGMVVITGFARNMNHIVTGTDNSYSQDPRGLWLGLLGIGVIVLFNVFANWIAWKHPRVVQHVAGWIVTPIMETLLNRAGPVAQFGREDISPYFWANGKPPTSHEWKELAAGGFRDYRLKVHGLVENPVELSLDEIKAMTKETQITLHHCLQGWSGIAEWGGLPLAALIALVRPKPNARVAVFWSFSEGMEGGAYYDTHSIANLMHPQSLLAYEMNSKPLNEVHGAPLRLRVENQLGFKMVKWIRAIEFVETYATVGEGEGGYNEDHEYFGEQASI